MPCAHFMFCNEQQNHTRFESVWMLKSQCLDFWKFFRLKQCSLNKSFNSTKYKSHAHFLFVFFFIFYYFKPKLMPPIISCCLDINVTFSSVFTLSIVSLFHSFVRSFNLLNMYTFHWKFEVDTFQLPNI